jgi:alkylated DNA nucleotide flippase Atl1
VTTQRREEEMDRDKLRTVVEGIPKGRWMSYADPTTAFGRGARRGGRRFR